LTIVDRRPNQVLRYRLTVTSQRTIATTTHGRFLIDIPSSDGPIPFLVGFHGYGEQADIQLERLRALRGESTFGLVSLQRLHRFYSTRGQTGHTDTADLPLREQVVASWMTRQDRELMIADNVTYVNGVLGALAEEFGEPPATVHVGFSQGASMAYRAAALGHRPPSGVIALGGDVPPDLGDEQLASIRRVLIGWGVRDRFYDIAKKDADERRRRDAGVRVSVGDLDCGQAWTDAVTATAAPWLSPFA
jgi:predicted esterase